MNFIKSLLLPNIRETIFRFPLPVLCSAIFTLLFAAKINWVDISIEPERWLYTLLLCGFFSYTVLRLFSENHNVSRKKYALLIIGLTGFLLYFCWMPSPIGLSLLLSGIVLLLLIAPYIFNDMGEAACCNFNTKLASSIFFSALTTVILCAGLSFALLSIKYLFDVTISTKLYTNIWLIGVSFFGPFYALSGVPKDFEAKEKEYPKGIAFIFSYILPPLIIGYFTILYAYIIKILIEWNLPKGNVAYMVLAFGLIGIFTHIFSYPLRETGTKLLKIVYRYFYYALLAPIVLLFISIGVRIGDYGVTEQRYLVVVFALWFLISSIYFIVKKEPRFKNIILSISTMLILSSFGVWGAVHISGVSQVARLQTVLEKNGILVDGAIHKISNEIDFEDQKNISSIVDYLSRGKKANLIKGWFENSSYINSTRDKHLDASKIMDDMGVSYISKWPVERRQSGEFNLSVPGFYGYHNNFVLLNIKNFDYYSNDGHASLSSSNWSRTFSIPDDPDRKLELYTVREGVLGIKHPNNDTSLQFDFTDSAKNIIKDGIRAGHIPESKRDLFILTKEKEGLVIRIYLKRIKGSVKDEVPMVSHIHFAIAVRYPDN